MTPDQQSEATTASAGASADGLFVFGAARELTPEQSAALESGLGQVGVNLTLAWPEVILREVIITLAGLSVGPRPTAEALIAAADPTVGRSSDEETGPVWLDGLGGVGPLVGVCRLGALGVAAIVVPAPLGLLLVDVLLGGSGRSMGPRSISAIDLDLLRALVLPSFDAAHAALAPAGSVGSVGLIAEYEELELSEMLGASMTAEFTVTLDENVTQMYLVMSGSLVSAVAGAPGGSSAAAEASDARRAIESVLAGVPLEAVIRFPPVNVSSRTVLGVGIGDVINLGLSTDELLSLRVEDLLFGNVRPARSGLGLACQVVSTPPLGSAEPSPVADEVADVPDFSSDFSSAPGGML